MNLLMTPKPDFHFSIFPIGFGLLISVPFVLHLDSAWTVAGWAVFLLIGVLPALFGLWKIEKIILTESEIIKVNFIGLWKQKRSLNDLVLVKKSKSELPFTLKRLNWISLFSNNPKYDNYRIMSLSFTHQRNLCIDERTMDSDDFTALRKKLIFLQKEQNKK